MEERRILFERIPWEEPIPGMRIKAAVRGSRRLRVVELTPEFSEPEGCASGHIGFVLEGELEIDFPERTESFGPQDGIFIPGGEDHRHRARVRGEIARLLLVDEVNE